MVPAFILMALAQWYVNSAYKKWSKVENKAGLSGADVARRLIEHSGLYGLELEAARGRQGQTDTAQRDHREPASGDEQLSGID